MKSCMYFLSIWGVHIWDCLKNVIIVLTVLITFLGSLVS